MGAAPATGGSISESGGTSSGVNGGAESGGSAGTPSAGASENGGGGTGGGVEPATGGSPSGGVAGTVGAAGAGGAVGGVTGNGGTTAGGAAQCSGGAAIDGGAFGTLDGREGEAGFGGWGRISRCAETACEEFEHCDGGIGIGLACGPGCTGSLVSCTCLCYAVAKACGMDCSLFDRCVSRCEMLSC